MESQEQYEAREIRGHFQKLGEISKLPLRDRQEGAGELEDALRNWKNSKSADRYLIERVAGWIYDGTWGAGPFYRFRKLKEGTKPRAFAIMLFHEAAMLNFMTDCRHVIKAFKKALPEKSDQEAFTREIMAEIKELDKE